MGAKTPTPAQLAVRKAFGEKMRALRAGKKAAQTPAPQTTNVAAPINSPAPNSGVKWSTVYKIVGGIVATIAIFYGGRWIYRTFIQNRANEAVDTAVDDVTRFRNSGFQQTFPNSEYNSIADSAYEGMRYSAVADDYKMVVEALTKMRNNLDVALLIVAYGTRQEYNFGIPAGQPKNLFQQVADDLSETRRKEINTDWNNKQITYQV